MSDGLRFLADESCDARVSAALRADGHDVLSVAAVASGATDPAVLRLAGTEHRIVLTEDRDFGRLVFAQGTSAGEGVIYIRCPESARGELPDRIASLVRRFGEELLRKFVVWTPRHVRVRPLVRETGIGEVRRFGDS